MKDFPTKITSKWILKKHLVRIIWMTSAQHSAINYPVDHYGALTLNMPTKLYKDNKAGAGHYGFSNIPREITCMVGTCVQEDIFLHLPQLRPPTLISTDPSCSYL